MKFKFKAFDKEGNFKGGTITAPSKDSALVALQNEGLVVTNVKSAGFAIKFPTSEKVSLKELGFITRELHILTKSRIPLDEAIKTLSEQASSKKLKKVLNGIYEDVLAGVPLSKALAKHPAVFSSYYVKMVEIGEISGSFDEVTDYLATNIENQNKFFNKIIQALIYPILVLVIFLIVMIVIFITIIPKIAQIYVDNRIPLPLITRIFSGISWFLFRNWLYVGVVSVILIFALARFLKTRKGKVFLLKFLDKIPIINKTISTAYLLRFIESFSFLIKGGLPIPESLHVVAQSVNNPILEDTLNSVSEETKRGKPVSAGLKSFPKIFPPLVVQSFVTGEKTGRLKEILFSIASYYSQELELRTATFSESVQPILIVILAVGLGFLEISMLVPILNLTNMMQSF